MNNNELLHRDYVVMLRNGTGCLDSVHERAVQRLEGAYKDRVRQLDEELNLCKFIRRALEAPKDSNAYKAATAFLAQFPSYEDE